MSYHLFITFQQLIILLHYSQHLSTCCTFLSYFSAQCQSEDYPGCMVHTFNIVKENGIQSSIRPLSYPLSTEMVLHKAGEYILDRSPVHHRR